MTKTKRKARKTCWGKQRGEIKLNMRGNFFFRDSYENENRNKIIILLKTE